MSTTILTLIVVSCAVQLIDTAARWYTAISRHLYAWKLNRANICLAGIGIPPLSPQNKAIRTYFDEVVKQARENEMATRVNEASSAELDKRLNGELKPTKMSVTSAFTPTAP